MTFLLSQRGRLALALVAVVLAGSAGAMTTVVSRPTSVSSLELGAGWQCQQFVWLTSCTHVQPIVPAVQNRHPVPDESRRV